MRHFLLLLFTVIGSLTSVYSQCPTITGAAFGSGCIENGSNCATSPINTGFTGFTGTSNGSWSIVGGTFQAAGGNPGNCVNLNSGTSYLLYNSKNCGIGSISFDHRKIGAGTSITFQLQYNKGDGWFNLGPATLGSTPAYASFSQFVNIYGDNIQIRVKIVSRIGVASLFIDNFIVTNYTITEPVTSGDAGCGGLFFFPNPSIPIPPNAYVVIFTSFNAPTIDYNFSSLCNSGYDIYVYQSSCTRTIGAFTNGNGTGLRTTNIGVPSIGCSTSLTYDTDNPAIDPQQDGDFVYIDENGMTQYGNNGCNSPALDPDRCPYCL
ncbi:MAG: hypothetical protein IPL13_12225 [Saprospiraceae bacterium]|nr:hypothetical protein [Candidatus Brachybacter algidus]